MASISASVELYDRMSAPLMSIMNAMNMTISSMRDMQSTMGSDMDTSSLDAATQAANQAQAAIEAMNQAMNGGNRNQGSAPQQTPSETPTPSTEPVQVPVEWVTPNNMDIYTNSGIERFQQEWQSANTMANQLASTQQSIAQTAANTNVFSDSAVSDMEGLGSRIQAIQDRIQQIESSPVELDDRMNNQLEVLRSQLTSAIQEQNNLNQAVADMDVSSANESFARLQQTVGTTERYIRDNLTQPVQVPVEIQWNGTGIDVFTGTGMDRFQQEVNATNQMLTTLSDRQNEIAQNAAGTDIFSDSAMQDINSMGQRIQAVQQRIQQIENNPVNFGTDTANAELEQLRSQLNQALQAQEDLNRAVQNMDVSAANAAYNQLSSTVANTERYIRDNADAQGNLNEQIQAGVQQSNEMVNTVKRLAAAYLSIQTLSSVIGVSDELVSTTARLDQMNDGLQTTDELLKMVYISAQDARGSFGDMAAVVAKFGNNAKDAFSSSQEVVAFANLIQKQMTIAGASTQEASNAMLQLSQALGSGVLRGDELNSIFEQAPNLIQSIADYLDVPIGKIREMAQDEKLTADIVKAAIFASADDINAKFEQMPMTWGQVWTSFQNSALMAFQPVLNKINELANNDQFQAFVESAIGLIAELAVYVLEFFNTLASIGGFISENWSIIAPIVYGVIAALTAYAVISGVVAAVNGIMATSAAVHAAAEAMQAGATFTATAAQYGLNAALMACPLTWILLIIIAVVAAIYAVVAAINKVTGSTISATGVIAGAIMSMVAFVWNLFLSLVDLVLGCINALVNPWISFANFFGNLFNDPIGAIVHLFGDMADSILGILESIASAIDKVFGSNLAGAVQGWRSGLDSMVESVANEYGNGAYEKVMDNLNLSSESLGLKRWSYGDAYNTGYSWGDDVADSVSNMFSGGGAGDIDLTGGIDPSFLDSSNFAQNAGNGIADTADNTGKIADSVDISSENLKYLRDIAEQEAINRFTTAEITVNQTNNNTVNNATDIDGMVSNLTAGVNEALNIAAEGVHK